MRLHPTPQQSEIVSQPLHSFRVAAGAGTGKTTTMAMRVVALVEELGLAPEEVLGITFTNKAAGELAERISDWLTDVVEPGREVEVHTYHGFAAQILREFGALVGIERDTKLVTPTFARQIITDVVRLADLRHWDLSNPFQVDRIAGFAAQMGDHLLRAEDIAVTGDDEVSLRRADLVRVLRLYEREKSRMGVVDYPDLIAAAWRVCRSHPEVAETIAARYRAVVLDEYQDTNPAQRELLRQIFTDRVPVTAVGDADQTIYEWRGASLENFAEFGSHFPNADGPGPSLPLTTNRRSGAAILAVANAIKDELGSSDHPLLPVEGTDPGEVHTAWFGTAALEAAWIADQIELLREDGVPAREMAVLFRKNKDMQIVHDALAARDIPFEVANLGGLLSVPEVADLVAWLRVLARSEDTVALARILTGSRFRLGLADLARLSDWVRGRRDEIEDDLEGLPDFTLLEAFDHLDEVTGLRPEARTALEQFGDEHRRFLASAQGLSLVELARTILDATGAWSDIAAMPNAAGLSAKLNLFRFLDLTESWSPLEGRPSLSAFTSYLELMRDNPREELDTARLSEADAVTLITVHRAKGLEWDVVFLPATYRDNFPSGYRGDDPYTSADILPFEYRLDRDSLPAIDATTDREERKRLLRARHFDSEWRLAYVAATRARTRLIVTGAWWYGHPLPHATPTAQSELFAMCEARATRDIPAPDIPPRPERAAYRVAATAPDPGIEGGWADALRNALEDPDWPRRRAGELGLLEAFEHADSSNQQRLFTLPDPPVAPVDHTVRTSATGLVTYAICPRRYEWSFVDPLPRRASRAARRGTEIHRRIELHNRGVMAIEDFSEAVYDMTDSDAAVPGIDPFATFQRSGYFDRDPLLTEAPFEYVGDEGTVRGRIDAVYADAGGWEIVDFKSGRSRPDDEQLVQLQTYALAAADGAFGPPPKRMAVSFVYLGDSEPTVRTHEVGERWLDDARGRVTGLMASIRTGDWAPTPSPACATCDFLRFCAEGRAEVADA